MTLLDPFLTPIQEAKRSFFDSGCRVSPVFEYTQSTDKKLREVLLTWSHVSWINFDVAVHILASTLKKYGNETAYLEHTGSLH